MTRTNGDLDRTNDRCARKRRRMHDYHARVARRRQQRDQCRLLALLTSTGVLRTW